MTLLGAVQIVSATNKPEGAIDLFYGKGLTGWEHYLVEPDVTMADVWSVQDGHLCGTGLFRNKNKCVCLDWRTGRKRCADTGVGKGSLTCANGMLYTLSINRLMGFVRPTPTEFKVVSSLEIPEGDKGKSWAHPVVCNGRLYLRHGEFLYAYGVR